MDQGHVVNRWDILKAECPKVFKHGIGFECDLGWYDIIRDVSNKIERILEKDAENYQCVEGEENAYCEMYAVQIKEKYGTLRYYMSCETDEISELIREAEALSSQTCERCGKFGKMRGKHWYEVRCDDCYSGER